MTLAEGNLLREQVRVGDQVQATTMLRGQYRLNTMDTFNVEEGDTFEVTRVYSESLVVRSTRTYSVREVRNYVTRNVDKRVSFQIDRAFLRPVDPNWTPPPPPRKLGTKPEGEGLIGIDHPGIQWLWEDMGAYATEKGYCREYDALTARLGIPGRPREFKVEYQAGPFVMTTTVMARSQAEANQKVKEAMAQQAETTPSPDLTPAA